VVPLGLAGGLWAAAPVEYCVHRIARVGVRQGHRRCFARHQLQVFGHLHALSLRFHLERQTGGMTRDIERGTRAMRSLISYSLYNILPTLIEVAMVLSLLAIKFDLWFAGIAIAALVAYISFTIAVTEWRTAVYQADERTRVGGAKPCHRRAAEL
jgi:ABC-type transport system involved in Fe-S cluster assembly fused permease/ATPase subunit